MRLNKFVFALLSLISLSAFAQEEAEESTNFFDRLSITPQIGKLYYLGDLQKEPIGSFFDAEENRLGYGFTLNYRISDVLSLSSGIMNGKLRGTNDEIKTSGATSNTANYGNGIEFRTDLLELTFPRLDLNLTRLIFKDKSSFFNKVSLGLFASQGLMNFDSKVYAINQDDVNLLYYEDRGRTGDTWEAVTTVGTTFSYIINDRFDVGLESAFKSVWNDKLDAWPTDGTANDMIAFTAVTFTYHFSPRKNVEKLGDKLEELNQVEETNSDESIEEKAEEKLEEIEESIEPKSTEEVQSDLKRIGVYKYNKLPMSNAALVVLDENGNPIDTIYTDGSGRFEFTVLQTDLNYGLRPLDLDGNNDNVEIYLTDQAGNRINTTEDSNGNFVFVKEGEERKEIPVAVERKPVKQEEVKTDASSSAKVSQSRGYFISVAAFRSLERAKIEAENLKEKGESPQIIANRTNTWYIVAIDRYESLEEAIPNMKKARENGYSKSWVLVKP